ncbi:MAG: glycoside hydrolase family 20 zincin-like fold domain-containing protein [Candidatus Fimenecus sp.]
MFNIVPQPNEMIITGGKTCFTLTPDTTMSKAPYIDEFRDFVKKQFDIRIHRDNENTENAILLLCTAEIADDEGYRLICRDGSIYIYGKTDAGCFYGLQTLKQLLLQGMGQIPDMFIADSPRCKYRGLWLGADKYAWTEKKLNRLTDLIALHKFNAIESEIPLAEMLPEKTLCEIEKYCQRRFVKLGTAAKNDAVLSYDLTAPYGTANLKQTYMRDSEPEKTLCGVQAKLYMRYIPNQNRADYYIFPRLGAIAETAWSAPEEKCYERFEAGLPEYFDLLNAFHIHYATIKQAMPSFVRGRAQCIWHMLQKDKKAEMSAENTD